jgi:hypothetical protein
MNTVVEQYIEFSWASQEQNGKMKITLTWTNVEMKRNKSKATRKRDRKRHEQYIEQKKVTENNKETEIVLTLSLECSTTELYPQMILLDQFCILKCIGWQQQNKIVYTSMNV